MTEQEKNIIKNEIMDALLYGSKTIDQLTLSSDISDADLFEISGGRAITYSTLKAAIAASIANGGGSGSGHTHANKDSLDQIATDSDGYIHLTYPKRVLNEATKEYETIITTEKVKAGYADKAGDLTEDSPVLKLINTIGNQFVPTYLDGNAYVDTTWAEIVAGTRTLAAIKSVKGFFSDEFISARGANSAGGGSTGGAYYLYELLDTAISNPSSGQALVYNGSKWVNSTVEQNEYILPAASASTLGGVKVGSTLAMTNGVLDQKAGIVSGGVYPKVTVDTYGRVTAGELLAASDIPNLPWSKITSGTPTTIAGYGITDTYTKTDADNRYVQQSLFDSMFAKESDGNGGFRIKAKYGLYSDSFISARGVNPDGGGSGSGGVYYLHELLDAAISNPASGQALVYNGTKWVNQAIQTGLDEAALASYLTTHSYATQSWVESKGYLTAHQSLANYVTLNTPQNITGAKTFSANVTFQQPVNTYGFRLRFLENAEFQGGFIGYDGANNIFSFGVHEAYDTNPSNDFNAISILRSNAYVGIGTLSPTQKLHVNGNALASQFIKSGGTASQFLMADGSVATKHVLTTANNLGWVGTQGQIPTIDTLAFWNGRYNATNSNLQYCDRGRFGTMAVANAADYLARSGGSMTNTNVVTNLNADLLDGLHIADIRGLGYAMQDTWIDASSLDVDTWYPVTLSLGSMNNVRIEVLVSLNSGTKPSWSLHNGGFSVRVIWEVNGSGWGASPINRTIYAADCGFTATSPVRGIGQMNHSSNEYVFVRGGGKYRFRTSHGAFPILRTSTYKPSTTDDQSVSPTTTAPAEIVRDNARTYDNVASATKLQTARMLWGQSFDGTANVSGSLTGVSSIGFNGDYELGIHNGRYVFGTTGQRSAVGANVGSLLVSNMWADATKVPTNGIYVKGDLRIGDITLSYDAANGGLHVTGGGLYADTYLSARGANTSGSGSTGGAYYLSDLLDTTISNPTTNQALVYNGTKWVNGAAGVNETQLAAYLTTNSYATQSWISTNFARALYGNDCDPQANLGEWMNYKTALGSADVRTDAPNSQGWYNVIQIVHRNGVADGPNYVGQIALGMTVAHDRMFFRTHRTRAWKEVLTAHQSLANYVTLNTTQTITGLKTFSAAGTTAIFNSTSTTATNVVLKTNGTQRSSIGWYNNFVFISNEPGYTGASTDKYHRLGITDAGVPQFWTNRDGSKYTLLHEGNYTTILDSRYVTALGTSGDYLTWTKNGATNNITVPYATTAAQLTGSAEHTGTALADFDRTHTYTCQATNDLGDGISYSAILTVSAGSEHRLFQLIGGKGNTSFLRWRTTDANGKALGAVRRLLDDANYSSVLDSRYYTESEINAKLTNGSVTKVGTTTVGSTAKGIYLSGGTPTALSATVGAANRPVYMSAGTITAGTYTFGNGSGNAPISNGTLCANLNADKLDGVHNGALTAQYLNIADFVTNLNAVPPINGICPWGGTNSANPATYGVLLQWSSVDNPTPGTDQHWITQLASATSNRLFYRTRINTGAWSGWSAVAFTSDNVASATKLQTARSLWGQSFNGTGNVDGALTVHHTGACGVYISGGGESSYSCQASGGLRWVSGGYPDRYFIWDSSNNERLSILNNGNVGIGTTSPSYKLDVSGVIHSTTGIWSNGYVSARGQNTASDARLKAIMQTKLLDTRSIAAAPSVLFSWKDDGREDVGSIAQYWQRIDRHLVSHRPDGYLGLDYGKAALLSVISVAKQTLNHEARIKALEKENARLKEQIKSLT